MAFRQEATDFEAVSLLPALRRTTTDLISWGSAQNLPRPFGLLTGVWPHAWLPALIKHRRWNIGEPSALGVAYLSVLQES